MSNLETTLQTTLDVLTSFYYSVGGKEEQEQVKEEVKKEDKPKDSLDFKTSLVNTVNPIIEMLDKKNQDYGNSYKNLLKKFNLIPFVIHAQEKLDRINSILFNEKGPNFEALEDSLKDLLGYTLLTLNFYEHK